MNISSFALHTPVSDKKPWKWMKTALRVNEKCQNCVSVENKTYAISLPFVTAGQRIRKPRIPREANKKRVSFQQIKGLFCGIFNKHVIKRQQNCS